MTEKLDQAIDAANFLINLSNLKDNIHLKMLTQLQYSYQGGIFHIDRELITFVKIILDSKRSTLVLLDQNNNPIEIVNIQEFYDEIVDRYFQATNFYHSEYTKLQEMRSSIDILSFFKD